MTLRIEKTLFPESSDVSFLTDQINEDSMKLGIHEKSSAFAFFIRDENEAIVGGCNGFVIYGAIYTDQLWIHEAHRRRGLGSKLMKKVHDWGREMACDLATVCTMSFQKARTFYECLGYKCDFEREGYFNGAKCIFMKKNLKE